MSNDLVFPDEQSASLTNFGLFHLNIDDAAKFSAKCLWENGELKLDNKDICDFSYDDIKQTPELAKAVNRYADIMVRAIEGGKLETALLKRDIDENILRDDTFLELDTLADFFAERNLEIYGDE